MSRKSLTPPTAGHTAATAQPSTDAVESGRGHSESSHVKVRVGQIWASTHNQDVQAGVRQWREVMVVDSTHAYLKTLHGPRRLGYPGVKLTRNGISGHRLVQESA